MMEVILFEDSFVLGHASTLDRLFTAGLFFRLIYKFAFFAIDSLSRRSIVSARPALSAFSAVKLFFISGSILDD